MALYPIPANEDFRRIAALPRRRWTKELGEEYARRLTPYLLTDAGRAAGAHLNAMQGLMLWEAAQVRGGFFGIPVGGGKTLASYLLPYVLDSPRTIYLNVANLQEDRERDFTMLAKHWVTQRPMMRRETYSMLYQETSWNLLLNFRPHLIIADEGDLLRNEDSSATMRVDEYMKSDEGKHCMFVLLTGTPLRKRLRDIAHILKWTHKERSPLPHRWVDLESWGNAVDEKIDGLIRRPPGALLELAAPEDHAEAQNELDLARLAVGRRIAETPGVILSDDQSCDSPIHIRVLQAPPDSALDDTFANFRRTMCRPDGWQLTGPLEMYMIGNELGCGFYQYWDPLPPTRWTVARQQWSRFCCQMIGTRSKRGALLATEKMVAREYADHPLYLEWKEIEPTFVPNPKPAWITGSVLGYAKEWLSSNGPAICWVLYNEVGEALSRMTGLPFYRAGGKTEQGQHIITHNPKKNAIASIHSNKRGRNLQAMNKNLVIGWPQPAPDVEQLIGRMHRYGQEHAVYLDVIVGCAEHFTALHRSYAEASCVRTLGRQTQKLLRAHIDTTHVYKSTGSRWDRDSVSVAA